MALLEVLQRKLVKTGGLNKLVRLLPRISLMLMIFSVLFMFNLARDGEYRHTYISENALMPSQAHPFFRESEWNFVRGYRNEVLDIEELPLTEKNQILDELLTSMGYKTEILDFKDPETGIVKPTLYAIYHVPKGDDTEAMVLATPWYNPDDKYNVNAIALTLGLARYFHRLSIWAKNIIIVFPEDGDAVLRNWVDAYHTTLDNTGGSIEAAIVLDCPSSSDNIGYIELDYAGINGQLPNLDLVNTAVMVSENENIKISINGAPLGQLWTNDLFSRIYSLFYGIFTIAGAGISKSLDSQCFSGWNVQAITFRAVEGDRNDITSFGRAIESTFRSVNNLLEKFHQSYFFYLMLAPRLFVSVGMYLPAGGLEFISFIVASINVWVGGADVSSDVVLKIQKSLSIKPGPLIWACLTIVSTILSCIFMALYTSKIFDKDIIFDYTKLTYNFFVIPLFVLSLAPIIMFFTFRIKINSDYARATSLIVLFLMGYDLFGLMVLNFPLTFVISLCSAPMMFVRYSSKPNFKTRIKNSILLFMSCPALWLVIFGILYKTEFNFDRLRNLIQYFEFPLLQREIQRVLDYIEVTDPQVFIDGPVELYVGLLKGYNRVQCWTWLFICFSWLPVWVCMNIVGSVYVYDELSVEDSEKKTQ
ncbi:Glycosyl phosphatidyl inositol protein transamidase complex subunit [Pichia californica]|nr:Glycosyl phosphatidyl inositol protein transamidase complex subunit [[Candida] californica]